MKTFLLWMVLGQSAHVGATGSTLFLTPPKGVTTPLATAPALTRNGNPVVLTPGPTSQGFWSFRLDMPVNPSDSLRLVAPDGWVAGAAAFDLEVRNSAGKCEFPIPDRPKMALGLNISAAFVGNGTPYGIARNWAERARNATWGVAMAFNDQGWPTQLTATTASTSIVGTPLSKMGGLWTVTYDTGDPLTELLLTRPTNKDWSVDLQPELGSPGLAGKGVVKVFAIHQDVSAETGLRINLTVTHPAKTPSFSNVRILAPGNRADDPSPLDEWTRQTLMIGAGRGPTVLRWMDSCATYGGLSNAANPEDLIGLTGRRGIPNKVVAVTSVRPHDPNISPAIYTAYGPFVIPADRVIFGSRSWVGEAVCDAPHGLVAGQQGEFRLPPVTVGGGKPVVAASAYAICWPTSATTFVFSAATGFATDAKTYDLDSPVGTPGVTFTVRYSWDSLVLPFETAAQLTSQFQDAMLWISIPALATDACVDAIAGKVFGNLAIGHKVIVEYSNETWNFGFVQASYCYTMSALMAGRNVGWPDVYTNRRAKDVWARFRAAAGDRAGDVLGCLAGQFGYMTRPLLVNAAKNGTIADVVAGGCYFGLPSSWDTTGWTVPQLHDLMRSYLKLDPTPSSWWRDYTASIQNYEAMIGRKVLRASYEGGIQWLSRDSMGWPYDPSAYWTEKLMYSQADAAGMDMFTYYTFLQPPPAKGSNWGLYNYQGQAETARGRAWRDWQRDYLLSR